MELNYDKLGDREKEIVKKQIKSQYNRLRFRKYASLSKFNPSSGAYNTKLRLLFDKELDNERLFYAYIYNLLYENNPISALEMDADINDIMFKHNVPIGQLADRLKDSIWMTKKRIIETKKLMMSAIELLEDQILIKKPDNQQILSATDKEQVKNTIISMINYVCETKKLLLDEALKEDEEPMFELSSLNPFNSPVKIQIIDNEPKQNGGYNRRTHKRHLRKTKRRRS